MFTHIAAFTVKSKPSWFVILVVGRSRKKRSGGTRIKDEDQKQKASNGVLSVCADYWCLAK
jgi:hypothetical protein